ncbi:type II toxin-antitoxin system VapB family antitoxin [Methylobacterium sp.]|uniref:type II toxin-antitoxin system VapB family antitoxin n=1 Tax=Methylobacterium sp. TaxID=409 RepID=UPI003C76B858
MIYGIFERGYAMSLYIRDGSVSELADRLAKMLGKNKTEAVRDALQKRLQALNEEESLPDRIKRVQDKARSAGIFADGFDDKPLMDDLSGGL